MSSKIWTGVLGAAAIAAGVAIYYMAQEEEEAKITFDPKIHTREKLIEILEQLEVEYASLYLHWYSMLKSKVKEIGKIPDDTLEAAKEQVQKLTDDVDTEVFSDFKLSKSFFDDWVAKYATDPEVKKISNKLQKNYEKLWKIEPLDFQFDFPREFTKEKYIKFIKVSYAKFRFDTYRETQRIIRESGQRQITEDQFNEIIKKCSLPAIKIDVYNIMGLPVVLGEKPTRTALKAYLQMMQNDESWHKEILHLQKEHKSILFSIPSGTKLEGMHEDPIEVLRREIEYEKKLPNGKQTSEAKIVGLDSTPADLPKKEEQKKSFGAFSFLGNEDKQKRLVDDFLNRDKKKKDESSTKKSLDVSAGEQKTEEIKDEVESASDLPVEDKPAEVKKLNIPDADNTTDVIEQHEEDKQGDGPVTHTETNKDDVAVFKDENPIVAPNAVAALAQEQNENGTQ